jgi:hypothetical protein
MGMSARCGERSRAVAESAARLERPGAGTVEPAKITDHILGPNAPFAQNLRSEEPQPPNPAVLSCKLVLTHDPGDPELYHQRRWPRV